MLMQLNAGNYFLAGMLGSFHLTAKCFRIIHQIMMMPANFPPLFAAERQEKIAAFVANRGKIRLDELAAVFDVSQPSYART